MKIFFATHNLDKKNEIDYILKSKLNVLYIDDFKDYPEIEETGENLYENALLKAKAGFKFTKLPSFGDDTILEVDAINKQPGLYTARFAGENATYRDNYNKLLKLMQNIPFEKRTARFITAIAFCIDNNKRYFFTGICEGLISLSPKGENGFGYDPVFIPNGYNKTFAELPAEIKHKISHRAKAIKQFTDFLRQYINGV